VCTYISPASGNQTGLSSCTAQSPSASNNYTTVNCFGTTGSGTADTLADVAMYYYQNDLRNDLTLHNCDGALGAASATIDGVCDDNVPTSGIDTNKAQHMTTYTLGLGARGRMAFSPTYETDTSGDFYSVWSPKPPTLGYTLAAPTATPPICSWQTVAGTKCNWPTPSSGQPENIDDLWHAAVNGRGTYFSASDSETLATGLLQTLKKINQVTGAAAAAATSTLNPTSTDHSAFVASYTTVEWTGNLESRDINIDTGVVSHTATWCVENVADGTCASPSTVVVDNAVHYCATAATDTNTDGVITAADCSALEVFDTATSTCRAQIQNTCTGTMAAKVNSTTSPRKIYTASGSTQINFSPTDSTFNTAYGAYFNATTLAGLSQWAALGTTNQALATANIVDYLRGNHNYEENRSTNTDAGRPWLFRYRDAVMGDALESQPTFVAAPTFSYGDAGYTAFKSAKANRTGMVFIGTNDGMLHAFYAQDRITYTAPAKCAVGAVVGDYCGGEEAWAYVPSMVIPNMWKLADRNYDANHVNFVNGSPVVSDYCPKAPSATCSASEWKTILVGGLNAGGRGFYALDITDTTNPLLLWEFTPAQDTNLGYSFGKPVVTKKADGTWVVLVSSGYNNGTVGSDNLSYAAYPGDGKGYLYVLNADTGSLLSTNGGGKIPTTAGSQGSPSGFAKFSAYNDISSNNQAGYVYGGDLEGNVWRFDINAAVSTGANPNPLQFSTLFSDTAGTLPQPITVAPTLGKLNNKDVADKRVIFVGTGKYLEKSTLYHNDLADTQTQSLYAIMDDDATTPFTNPRSVTQATPAPNPPVAGKMVKQTISFGTTQTSSRTIVAPKPVNFSRDRGWYVDFPESGERTNIDFKLVQGTLIVPTIVPTSTACSQGGHGWLNYLNYETGGPVVTNPLDPNHVVSQYYGSPIVGTNVIYIHGAPIVEVVTSEEPTPTIPVETIPFRVAPGGFSNQRETWRELIP
jgi:type IV pilus assembly protein PilY1